MARTPAFSVQTVQNFGEQRTFPLSGALAVNIRDFSRPFGPSDQFDLTGFSEANGILST
jgi:hypothetical protein